MLGFLNLITNNYFLKQKLKIEPINFQERRLTDNWQGDTIKGQKIISGKINPKQISDFNNFKFLRDFESDIFVIFLFSLTIHYYYKY